MGVSGCGKSTVGSLLAARLGLAFVDADSLHPASNVAKMARGIALTDDDRWPWLDAVAAELSAGSVVVACSALRRRYRDRIRLAAPALHLVYLRGDALLVLDRMTGREHFMPPSLLASQLTTLEPPAPDEAAVVVDIGRTPAEIVDELVELLELR